MPRRDGEIRRAPGRIVDYLALMGDSVDNIPGVDKCGPKTAAKWLAAYGSLDGVIAHAGRSAARSARTCAPLPRLPLNRELATIKTDVSWKGGPAELALRDADVEACARCTRATASTRR
jgi:DNA polymerase-1